MKRSLLVFVLLSLFSSLSAQSTQYTVSGGSGVPLAVNVDKYRLQVYLLNKLTGAQISIPSTDSVTWYQYQQNANTATTVTSFQSGNTSYITDIHDGCGYFVGSTNNPLTQYVWIIDYSKYAPADFVSLQPLEDENRCSYLTIEANLGASSQPTYRLPVSAPPVTLEGMYHLKYNTLLWDEKNNQFLPQAIDSLVNSTTVSQISISPPPLINTTFTLTGDNFAEYFGLQKTITSAEYQAIAVKAYLTAETTREFANNEIHHAGDVMGGSAPIDYTFTAYANEPTAAMYNWKILQLDSATQTLTQIVRYTDKVLPPQTFDKNGTYIVALEVSDAQSICIDTTQRLKIVIDNTLVKIPNAFSPGSSFGANDILKVAFTSVITFKASVINRWGNLLFQWTDPSSGWDGRINGKFAPTGVYYVIVEYKDSNGKNRNISQAVNLLRTKD